MHPGMSAEVTVDRKPVGFIGRVHPQVRKDEVYVLELNLNMLADLKTKAIKHKEPSKYPNVVKDLAFVMDKDVSSLVVKDQIKKSGSRLLVDIDIFDVYVGENVGNDEKSIAFNLTFQDPSRTLSDEEVMQLFNKAIESVTTKLNAVLRDK
jgi:phenylalanyl-tRNA synthetase beta chain